MATGDKKRAVMTTDIDNSDSTYPVLSPSGDGSDVTAAFTAAASRTNISTGEKLTVIFGKVAKWFSDLGAAAFRGVDAAPTAGSTNLVESGGVKSAITHDIANIVATGTTNTTGATIASGKFFYLNGVLVQAIGSGISTGAPFTLNTNYKVVTAGGLNELKAAFNPVLLGTTTFTTFDSSNKPTISLSEAISNYLFISVVLAVNTTEQGATTIPVTSNLRSTTARVDESPSIFGYAFITNLNTLEATVFNFYTNDAVWASTVQKRISIYGIGKN